jgi:predicted AAA+ superfamily ATPase
METVNRILQEKITARIAPNKAVLIFGARRVGKTVMMRKIVDNYSGRTMMLNGEDYDTLALLENRSIANYRHLLDGIDLLAIDEAQNIPQIGSILKLIVDEIPGISVLASGSSSFDLLNKVNRWSAAVRNFSLHHSRNGKSHRRKRHLKPARTSKRA